MDIAIHNSKKKVSVSDDAFAASFNETLVHQLVVSYMADTDVLICCHFNYSIILDTTPAPTVRPPSRIAKRRPSSIAIGAISVTSIFTLSPGITISTPDGNSHAPVTSVVRKVKLGTITIEERCMTTAFFLRQNIYFTFKLGMRRNRSRLRPVPDHAPHLHAWCHATIYQHCRPPHPGPAACGTSQHPYRLSSRSP